jgi:hypothetical protein
MLMQVKAKHIDQTTVSNEYAKLHMNDEHDLGMSGELLLDPGSSYRLEV